MISAIRSIIRRWSPDTGLHPLCALVEEWNKEKIGEVALDPANLAAGATREDTVALPAGTAAAGALVYVQAPSNLSAGLIVQKVRISAANTLAITLFNPTAGAIDAPNGLWTYHIVNAVSLAVL